MFIFIFISFYSILFLIFFNYTIFILINTDENNIFNFLLIIKIQYLILYFLLYYCILYFLFFFYLFI